MTPADRPTITDDARAEMRRVLEDQFWPFLAHGPHDPERFWGLAVDVVMRAAARAETTTDLHWSNAAAAEYPGDEYEQYPLRTAFGRGVKWERKRAEATTEDAAQATDSNPDRMERALRAVLEICEGLAYENARTTPREYAAQARAEVADTIRAAIEEALA